NLANLLDQALGRQAVVVEADGIENVASGHALVAGQYIRLGIAVDMPDMEHARDGWRRRVDDEGLTDRRFCLPGIYALLLPVGLPFCLDCGGVIFVCEFHEQYC